MRDQIVKYSNSKRTHCQKEVRLPRKRECFLRMGVTKIRIGVVTITKSVGGHYES